MPYVMVPVPEEHVQEVMEFVIRTVARASIDAWTTESMEQAFLEVDEASRSLLSVVARARDVRQGDHRPDAADFLQLSQRETSGILREVNDVARERKRPAFISCRVRSTEELPNGRTREEDAPDDDAAHRAAWSGRPNVLPLAPNRIRSRAEPDDRSRTAIRRRCDEYSDVEYVFEAHTNAATARSRVRPRSLAAATVHGRARQGRSPRLELEHAAR